MGNHIQRKEHTMRTCKRNRYIPGAMSTQQVMYAELGDMSMQRALCCAHEAVANMTRWVGPAFHGETHTMGGTPALAKLGTRTYIYVCIPEAREVTKARKSRKSLVSISPVE